jgi:hypothetical protein
VDNLFAGRGARVALVHRRFDVLRHDRVELDDDLNFAYPASSARPNGSRHALSQASTDRRHLMSDRTGFWDDAAKPTLETLVKRIIAPRGRPSSRMLAARSSQVWMIPAPSMVPRSIPPFDHGALSGCAETRCHRNNQLLRADIGSQMPSQPKVYACHQVVSNSGAGEPQSMALNILVTGGAGYVGSHACTACSWHVDRLASMRGNGPKKQSAYDSHFI